MRNGIVGRPGVGRRGALALLALVLLAGAVLRVRFAVESPHPERFFDEGFALRNPASILDERTLEPANSYYPSPVFNLPPALLLGLSQELAERTGNPAFAIRGEAGWAPMAYYVTRLLQTFYGLVGIWLTYRVGRRMFSRRAGLIAALALAAAPWHIHASSYFKPDALLATTVLLAFLLSLRAASRPTVARHLAAGGGIALAMSGKITGGLVAVPLAVSAVLAAPRPRRLALLALAGVASAAVFALLNPYWGAYLFWLDNLSDDYAMRAGWREMTRLEIPGRVLALVTGPTVLGPALGWASLAAGLALAASVGRRATPPRLRVERIMLLVFPVVYVVAYAIQTPYFKANNFLPVIPFLCLVLGWGADRVWGWCERRAAWLRGRWAAAAVAALLVLALLPRGVLYVYRSLVRTTTDVALYFLRAEEGSAAGRVVLVERHARRPPPWERAQPFSHGQSAVVEVQRLDRVAEQRLALADGEVFLRGRLRGEGAAFYRTRIENAPPQTVLELEPRLFEMRGTPLVAIRRPRLERSGPLKLDAASCGRDRGCFAAPLPADLPTGALVSLSLWLPFRVTGVEPRPLAVDVGEATLPLLTASRSTHSALYVTERFRAPAPGAELRFVAGQPVDQRARIAVTLHHWRKRVETGGKWSSG